MAESKFDSANFKWENMRARLARAIAFARSQAVNDGLSGTTLESSIAEAIISLDTSQSGLLGTLGEGDTYVEEDYGNINTGRGKGRIQKVEDLITLYYGDDETEGLFDQLRALAEPEV